MSGLRAIGHPRVLVLVPDQQGGIRSLFEQLARQEGLASETELIYFHSHDMSRLAWPRLPLRLMSFAVICLRKGFDLCHINLSSRGSTVRKILFAWLCRLTGRKYVIHLHGSGYDEYYRALPGWMKGFVRRLFQKATKVIVLGTNWRDFVIDELATPQARVVIVPNAVAGPKDTESFERGKTPSLLFLGQLGARKGVPELVSALGSARLKSLAWTAVLAGDGDVEKFRNDVQEAGLADRVSLPGWVGPLDVERYLRQSDILVLPAYAENLPLSMLEGMGYGLCPVVTPVGAVPDVIRDGENGLLVPVGDSDALAVALARVIEDEELRQKLGTAARRDFEASYDIRHYREKLEATYLDALAEA